MIGSIPGEGSPFMCMPCDGPSRSFAQMQKLSLAVESSLGGDNGSHRHLIPQSMKTFGLKIKGTFDLKQLERCLDTLLYANGTYDGVGDKNTTDHTKESKSLQAPGVSPPPLPPFIEPTINKQIQPTGYGPEIYRLKGIVRIAGSSRLHIIQSVHDVFEITEASFDVGGKGDITNGENLFVIIGKMVVIEDIERGFRGCLLSNS